MVEEHVRQLELADKDDPSLPFKGDFSLIRWDAPEEVIDTFTIKQEKDRVYIY